MPVVWTKAFRSQAVLLKLASKPPKSLEEEMDLALPLNFSAVAEHCYSPLQGSFFFSLLVEILCHQVRGTGAPPACQPSPSTSTPVPPSSSSTPDPPLLHGLVCAELCKISKGRGSAAEEGCSGVGGESHEGVGWRTVFVPYQQTPRSHGKAELPPWPSRDMLVAAGAE